MNTMFNVTDLIILLLVLYLQIRNFIKYRYKNGAGRKRIVMMLSVMFLVVHVVRLMFDITTGFFLLLHVVTWLLIYDAVDFSGVMSWIKARFK